MSKNTIWSEPATLWLVVYIYNNIFDTKFASILEKFNLFCKFLSKTILLIWKLRYYYNNGVNFS